MPHIPVLLDEVVALFDKMHLRVFYEGTVGAGGHAEALLKAHPEIERYIACDRDKEALKIAQERLQPWADKVVFVHGNFCDVDKHLEEFGEETVDGLLFDLGVSSMQLDEKTRGFSFSKEGPLDMRMDTEAPLTAEEVVNTHSEEKLGELFRDVGEEPRWKRAAHAVVRARRKKPLRTTRELSDIIEEELGRSSKKKLHPATLIFQALRIYVNRELESISEGIKKAVRHLSTHGRIAVISFHSFEDRIVKNIFRDAQQKKANKFRAQSQKTYEHALKIVTKKPIVPSTEEIRNNRRSRSAKLRSAQKV